MNAVTLLLYSDPWQAFKLAVNTVYYFYKQIQEINKIFLYSISGVFTTILNSTSKFVSVSIKYFTLRLYSFKYIIKLNIYKYAFKTLNKVNVRCLVHKYKYIYFINSYHTVVLT
jgi:hypothetical protein